MAITDYFLPRLPASQLVPRLGRVVPGLVIFGVGIGLMAVAGLGLPPWDVFHEGVADRVGSTLGVVGIAVSVVLLFVLLPLRERIGIGTILNAVLIGLAVDATLAVLDQPEAMVWRVVLMALGPPLVGLGSGLYIGGGLGPGPRDGIMTALAARGVTVWKARAAIEIAVFAAGVLLGGTIGVGTVWFLVSIGPWVQVFLARLTLAPPVTAD